MEEKRAKNKRKKKEKLEYTIERKGAETYSEKREVDKRINGME